MVPLPQVKVQIPFENTIKVTHQINPLEKGDGVQKSY